MKSFSFDAFRKIKAWLHKILANVFLFLLTWFICRSMKPTQKTALIFAPHQDDETLGCGGMIALKRKQRIPVSVVFLADGHGSHKNHPRITSEELRGIRKTEAKAALAVLGVEPSSIYLLDLPDGSLSDISQNDRRDVIEKLVGLLKSISPEEVYVTYRHDVHKDHEATYDLITAAICDSGLSIELLQYPIWVMWYPWQANFELSDLTSSYKLPISSVLSQKRQAILSYESQYLPQSPDLTSAIPWNFFHLFMKPNEIFIIKK